MKLIIIILLISILSFKLTNTSAQPYKLPVKSILGNYTGFIIEVRQPLSIRLVNLVIKRYSFKFKPDNILPGERSSSFGGDMAVNDEYFNNRYKWCDTFRVLMQTYAQDSVRIHASGLIGHGNHRLIALGVITIDSSVMYNDTGNIVKYNTVTVTGRMEWGSACSSLIGLIYLWKKE